MPSQTDALPQSTIAGSIRHTLAILPAKAEVQVEIEESDGTIRIGRVQRIMTVQPKEKAAGQPSRMILRVKEEG